MRRVREEQRLYLICYDISEDPKRLTKVARYISRHAWRVQYSVFVGRFSTKNLEKVLEGLNQIIDPRKDDVRCYPLPREADVVMRGQQIFPEDILLIHDGANLLQLGAKIGKDNFDTKRPEEKNTFGSD